MTTPHNAARALAAIEPALKHRRETVASRIISAPAKLGRPVAPAARKPAITTPVASRSADPSVEILASLESLGAVAPGTAAAPVQPLVRSEQPAQASQEDILQSLRDMGLAE